MHHDVRDPLGWSVFDPIADKLISAHQTKPDTRTAPFRFDNLVRRQSQGDLDEI